MGILQAAYRTYEHYANLAGVIEAGKQEPLIPVSHQISKAYIEIVLSEAGIFQTAKSLKGEKTIIPVTVESAGRTSTKIAAHPLCDQLQYLVPANQKKYENYVQTLSKWTKSPFAHPILNAVLQYIERGTIVEDLVSSGMIQLGNAGKLKEADGKNLVRWHVLGCPQGDGRCWCNQELFQCFADYYANQLRSENRDLCMVTGQQDVVCGSHPKGVLAFANGAKLVSANDSTGFTFRGRFCLESEAGNVGYFASQKAHSALRYVAANFGVRIGPRMFLCWNPEGKKVQRMDYLGLPSGELHEMDNYKQELRKTLYGAGQQLQDWDDVVVASLEAATTGRLSVTYYRELKASDYLARIEKWYGDCCYMGGHGIWSPKIQNIVDYAFGVQRKGNMDVDKKLQAQQFQRLVHCIVDAQAVPMDVVLALFHKASNLQAYDQKNEDGGKSHRAMLVYTACAIIRKYRNDRKGKEVWKLTLNVEERNRSYLFGRLLAVAELAERRTYDKEETREPYAIRMQSVFSRRPMYAWRMIRENLNPYLARMVPGARISYERWMDEIMEKLSLTDASELNRSLEDVYLLGYSHQRTAMFNQKKDADDKKEDKHELSGEEN